MILQQLGGEITVTSEFDKGSSFKFNFPVERFQLSVIIPPAPIQQNLLPSHRRMMNEYLLIDEDEIDDVQMTSSVEDFYTLTQTLQFYELNMATQ